MSARRRFLRLLLALGCCLPLSCAGGVDLGGAGATFPAPLYKRWFLEYYHLHPDVRVNYQAIGSGAGIRQFSSDLVEFGASDAAMSDKEIASAVQQRPAREGVLLLPMTAGSVAVCYNAPGAPADLRLSRQALVDIFLGKITSWADPALASLNPGVSLPDKNITVVRRAEGSGTTYAFTNHLGHVSKEWKDGPGIGKSVVWPVGIGGRGNAGVAAIIQQTPGAVGYLEFGYADLLHLPMARLENKAGNFVAPNLETGLAALEGVEIPADLRAWVPDPPGKNAYPIVTYTWILCSKDYSYRGTNTAVLKEVLRYCLTDGQKVSAELGYLPLPEDMANRVLKAVDTIKP
jgi:phosphate transport system substrate-binding protein